MFLLDSKPVCLFRRIIFYIFYHQTCQHKTKDSGDMSKRTIDLGFRRAPLVVQQTLVAWTILGFGAHALLGATGGIMPPVLQ